MLSIVVSWRDRHELRQALPSLVAAAKEVGGDVTIVRFGGSLSLLGEQLGSFARDVNVVSAEVPGWFSKPRAQNLGAANTREDILFFCDCDIIVDPTGIRALVEELALQPGCFATLAGVRESQVNSRGGKHVISFGYELQIKTADGRRLYIKDNEEDASDGTRQAPGLLFVRRSDFLSINGYNSCLLGWGWEDQDMIGRLTLGANLRRITRGHAVHISHDDRARVAHYPDANRWDSRDRMFRQALANYDDANFQGTYDRDIRDVAVKCFGGEEVASRLEASLQEGL